MEKKSSKGISLISLIITIIVIIILAAIVIFSGMGTPEKAQLSAVVSDIDNVQTAVDQAYYGLYAEKSVAGEVWTKGQLYESIATGESNREDLSGAGIVEITETGMVKMSLPKYEGRKWGVAVEDIDETTKTGSVVLLPGYETDGKIYSTLLDTQTGGRDSQLEETINANIKVKDLKITTDSSGTTLAGEKIDEGTKLYISFDVSQNASTVTVTPSIPYEVTENGSYIFTLANIEGKTKKYKVNVDNYLVPTLPNVVKIGDYVDYKPDVKTYTTRPEYTGASAQTFTTESTNWRVVGIDEESGKTYITTDKVVNNGVNIKGIIGFFEGDTEIETICKELYSNQGIGLNAESFSTDIWGKIIKFKVTGKEFRGYAYYPKGTILSGESTIEYKGNQYVKKVHGEGPARFYIGEGEMTPQTDSNGYIYRVPEISKPVYVDDSIETGSKTISTEDYQKIKNILGNTSAWYVGDRTINLREDSEMLLKSTVIDGYQWGALVMYFSNKTGEYYGSAALRPIVEIDSSVLVNKINNPTNDGSTAAKAWKLIKK